MLVAILTSLAALQTILIVLLLLRRPVYIEPENSHPGRVLPKGVPIGHALKSSPEPVEEPHEPKFHVPYQGCEPCSRLPIGDPKDRLRDLLGHPYPPAEQATLGAMIFDPDQIPGVAAILPEPGMFSAPRHVLIYQAILRLHREGLMVDLVTLRDELAWNCLIDLVGGPLYLMELVESVPNSAHATEYALHIRDRFIRRIA